MNRRSDKPSPTATLIEFLDSAGSRPEIFDMGRRLVTIPRGRFLSFEKCALPYPYPLQREAWFALLFRGWGEAGQPLIWFLRLPLDEQGKLNQAARDELMHRLLERIGQRPDASQENYRMETALQDNPYSFKPRDDRLAVFHARASRLLQHPPSRFYAHARDYFRGELGWDQWPFVGYQGIADLAARLSEEENEAILAEAIPRLPDRPFEAVCHCLENVTVSLAVARPLLSRTETSLKQGQPAPASIAAAVRGISRSRSATTRRKLLQMVLSSAIGAHPEVLAAISGRAWDSLTEATLATPFLENLALSSAGQTFFDQCLADLLFIPGMREPILNALRAPDRSPALSRSVGLFFQGVRGR